MDKMVKREFEMRLSKADAELFVPDGLEEKKALGRTTHLGIGAHQDDLEIMAWHGISACFNSSGEWFSGVVVTDGAGSPRAGIYAELSDDEMRNVRKKEQRKAAVVGEYAVQIQLGFDSNEVKDPRCRAPVDDLIRIFSATRPETVYLHNPADKHDTHVAVTARALEALRAMDDTWRPKRVLGCEVWRDLDWLPDEEKEALHLPDGGSLAMTLLGVFDSQISGGKRYDLATAGRRLAHATYHESHEVDAAPQVTFAMDLTPLVEDKELSLSEFTLRFIDMFKKDVKSRILRFSENPS
jgi:LmbE family N-acetylglucosaminyl deacetylase